MIQLFQINEGISLSIDLTQSQLLNTSSAPFVRPYFSLQSVGQLYTLDTITIDPDRFKRGTKSILFNYRVMFNGSDDVSAADYESNNFSFGLIGNPRTGQAIYFGTNPLIYSNKAGTTSYVSGHFINQGSAPFYVSPSDVIEIITRQMTVTTPIGKLQANLTYDSNPSWSTIVCGPGSSLA